MATYAPFARPLYVMLKPASSHCNLNCAYCYYVEKANIYRHGKASAPMTMSMATLERFTKQYIEAQTQPQVMFTWHGGEPLLRPIAFYEKALRLQRQYASGHVIENSLQTNGTLLTDEWCDFLARNHFLVGISIDGPQAFHDEYRRARGGDPSFDKVMRGIRLLKKHGVEWNAMTVVNRSNADHPREFYDFFKHIGAKFLQFTPIVERILPHDDGRHLASMADGDGARLADFSVSPEQYGGFLCSLFDEWVRADVGQTFIQLFDSTLSLWAGQPAGVCSMAETCGHAAVMEYNGDMYCCDHFVFPEYRLGNIGDTTITGMMYSERQRRFGATKKTSLPRQCRECEWLRACNGGCPKDRFARTADGQPGLNYLCSAFRRYYRHVAPYMDFMLNELLNERPPANVMAWAKTRRRS